MQSKVWFIIVATVCVVTFAIAQEESSESPATVTTGSISDSIEQSAQDNIARDSYSAKSDEEIANEISKSDSREAKIFGDSIGKDYLPVDI